MMGKTTSTVLEGILLVSAGVFQWTPLKNRCLKYCRTPIGFVMAEWKEGVYGALKMGLKHGKYCLICCWLVMALLFVLGIMNLVWICALTVFVLLEKIVPKEKWIGRISGIGLVIWGILLLFGFLA